MRESKNDSQGGKNGAGDREAWEGPERCRPENKDGEPCGPASWWPSPAKSPVFIVLNSCLQIALGPLCKSPAGRFLLLATQSRFPEWSAKQHIHEETSRKPCCSKKCLHFPVSFPPHCHGHVHIRGETSSLSLEFQQ